MSFNFPNNLICAATSTLFCTALVAIKIVPRQLGCSAPLCEFYAHDYIAFLILGIFHFTCGTASKGLLKILRRLLIKRSDPPKLPVPRPA